ncbi:MAG: FAD-dependent oxidoreductase [Syntrophobacterales bacterium]|jgi:NAD(P)H-nitrite reductase large subunit|nr:FAD-dependent oxidoreductase [Syntrophobacterales bacterium]
MRYVIIGASAAGCAAAETLRRYAPHDPITVISEEAQPLYSRPLLTYLLSGEITREAVWLKGREYFQELALEPILGEPVTRVDPDSHAVHLLGGRVVAYDRLLIASGARPRLLGLLGEDLAGVYTLRTLADWQRLEAGLPPTGRVVVVGAGAVGLKTADALARRGLQVTLVARGSQPLSRVLDPTAASLLHGAITRMGIELIYQSWPEAIWGEHGQVKALTLNGGREIPCDAVLFSVGVAPNVEFLAGTDLATAEGIPVDQGMTSSDPDILAAGDCAHAYHLLTGKRAGYHIWPAAVAQGRIAGANLAGAGLTYDGLLPQNSLSLRGFHIITGGLGPQDTGDCEIVSELDLSRGQYRRLAYRDGRLVGLILVGAVADAGIYFQLMARQVPVPEPVQPGRMWG